MIGLNNMELNNAVQAELDELKSYSPPNHFLWNETELFCSPAKTDLMEKIRKCGLENLSSDNWNTLMFSVVYTIGDERSFDYLLPLYLEKVFSDKIEIIHFETDQLISKLDYVKYQDWPKSKHEAIDTLLSFYKEKENNF